MGRGLGKQQRKVLDAVRAIEAKRGTEWVAPGEVLVEMEKPTGDPRLDALKMTIRLIEADQRAAQGDPNAAALVADLERQGASRSWKSSSFSPAKPVGKRLSPARRRNAERINPARIFAALEERGLIERKPGVGPASRLRLTAPTDPKI